MYDILNTTDNIVIAGGAAAKPLYLKENKHVYTDYDIFIYGILDKESFWNKVNNIINKINESLKLKEYYVYQKIKKGIVIVVGTRDGQIKMEFQVILRMYHTLSSIIHAFDIPSCCVAYDGTTAYTTTLGAYAHSNQVNLAIVQNRSLTFEKRLCKYFTRGFGIALINYNIEKGYVKDRVRGENFNRLKHNYLKINITNRDGNKLIGNIYPLYGGMIKIDEDYSSIRPKLCSYNEAVVEIQSIENLGLVLHADKVNFTEFYEMTASHIVDKFKMGIDKLIWNLVYKIMDYPIHKIKKLNLPINVIMILIQLLIDTDDRDARNTIYDVLKEQIIIHGNYIPEWVIIQDPQRQYTASINPIIEDPEDWYGSELYIKN